MALSSGQHISTALRMELNHRVRFHFSTTTDQHVCQIRDKDNQVVAEGRGLDEDYAFEAACKAFDPNKEENERRSLEERNAELEAKLRDLESGVSPAAAADSQKSDGDDSLASEEVNEKPVRKKKTTRKSATFDL